LLLVRGAVIHTSSVPEASRHALRAPDRPLRTSTELAVLLALSGIAATVPWLSKYWLFDHSPSNLAAVHIIQSLAADPNGTLAQHFTDQLRFAPYSLHSWLLLALSAVTGLHDAHRILVSALTVAMPLSVYLALRRVAPEHRVNAWLYVPLGITIFVGGGMQGFALCLPPMLTAWAIVCAAQPTAGRQRRVEIAGAAALFLVAALAHPVGPVLGAIAIALFQGRRLVRPRALIEAALALAPAFLFAAVSELRSHAPRADTVGYLELAWSSAERALHYFYQGFRVTSRLEVVVRFPVFALVAWGFFRALSRDRARALPFARIAAFFLVMTLVGPLRIGDATVTHRFAFLLVIFVTLGADLPPFLTPRRIALVSLAAVIAVATIEHRNARHVDTVFDDVIALGERIPRGSTLFPLSFQRDDFMRTYRRNLQPWSYLVVTRDLVTPYLPASGAIGQSGHELRPIAYRHPPSADYLPAPYPMRAPEDPCKKLELTVAEDCRSVRMLRYRSYVAQAQKYDRALVIEPPAELVSELSRALILEERRGDIWLFRPRPGADSRSTAN
jgi:hypothetical protein